MTDPSARHAEALRRLDWLIETAEAADRSRWMADVAQASPTRMRSEDDARYLVSVTPGSVLPMLRGRRSILQRHAPERQKIRGEWVWLCARDRFMWEDCPDWRDAAAGLESTDGT